MALLLKRIYEGYFHLMNDVADPRTKDFPLMSGPFFVIALVTLYIKFVFNWGPAYMKHRPPYDIKKIMMVYNVTQVLWNIHILRTILAAADTASWCMEIDYSNSYWGLLFLDTVYSYHWLKIYDLLDTVFFVLRKKERHISFLHTYHHCGMVLMTWVATKFVGGGHAYVLGFTNTIVHIVLYSYYLLTSYDSRYGQLVWLKKFITQLQLIQFVILFFSFSALLFIKNCNYPKIVTFFFIPQNLFMIILFGDFYIQTYIKPRKNKTSKNELSKTETDHQHQE